MQNQQNRGQQQRHGRDEGQMPNRNRTGVEEVPEGDREKSRLDNETREALDEVDGPLEGDDEAADLEGIEEAETDPAKNVPSA